jgi:hypothetical protein
MCESRLGPLLICDDATCHCAAFLHWDWQQFAAAAASRIDIESLDLARLFSTRQLPAYAWHLARNQLIEDTARRVSILQEIEV